MNQTGAAHITNCESLRLTGRPLLILDADEVLFKFIDGLMCGLDRQGLFLDLASYRLHGNVKRKTDHQPLTDAEVTSLLDRFRHEQDQLDAVDGAGHVLQNLARNMDIAVLSNITAEQAPARARNLQRHGFNYPLIPNSGLKGPAVKMLAVRAVAPLFFVDDIPAQLASVADEAPEVRLIHFIADARLKHLLPVAEHAHFRAEVWKDIESFILTDLERIYAPGN